MVVQATYVHPEYHISQSMILSMDGEHVIFTFIWHMIRLFDVFEGQYIGDGFLQKPYWLAFVNDGNVVNHHVAAVAL